MLDHILRSIEPEIERVLRDDPGNMPNTLILPVSVKMDVESTYDVAPSKVIVCGVELEISYDENMTERHAGLAWKNDGATLSDSGDKTVAYLGDLYRTMNDCYQEVLAQGGVPEAVIMNDAHWPPKVDVPDTVQMNDGNDLMLVLSSACVKGMILFGGYE